MNYQKIWDLPGKKWRAKRQRKSRKTEKRQSDGGGATLHHQVSPSQRPQTWRYRCGTFHSVRRGCMHPAEHKILATSTQAGANRPHDTTCWRETNLDDTDAEIRSVLRISPFSVVRTIADSLGIPVSTVYLPLVEKIGFKNYFLRWVPPMLTEARSCGRKKSNSRGNYLSSLKANEELTSARLWLGTSHGFYSTMNMRGSRACQPMRSHKSETHDLLPKNYAHRVLELPRHRLDQLAPTSSKV
jgi:hypothetical protein